MADNYDRPPTHYSERVLYRRADDKILAGVCGGLADYFGVDVTLVRVLWLVFCIFYFMGVIVYIILVLVVPIEPTGNIDWSPRSSGGPAPQ